MIKLKLEKEQMFLICAMLNSKDHKERLRRKIEAGEIYHSAIHALSIELGIKLGKKYIIAPRPTYKLRLSISEACALYDKTSRELMNICSEICNTAYNESALLKVKREIHKQLIDQNFNYYGN